MNWFSKISLAVVAITLAACGVSVESKDSSASGSGSKSAKGDVGNWKILTKQPQFQKEYGMWKTVRLDVRNVSNEADEPWLEITLTNKAGDLVATFDCVGRTVKPKQKTTLECTSLDDPAPFTKYEIQNAF